MNFDFLKDLCGLGIVYKQCADAEELVKSKPYLSLAAARKSAELLAQFVYMAAHTAALPRLSFVDILADDQVRDFINDRYVMDAFHFIRKNGNIAVHGNQETDPNIALSVLQNLHFVAGEIAKDLDLISSYPDFDDNIIDNPLATFDDDMIIPEDVIQIFSEYIQQNGINEKRKLAQLNLDNPAHMLYVLQGRVEMHEYIQFNNKPYYQTTLEYIQHYIAYLKNMEFQRKNNSDLLDAVLTNITITINDSIVYKNDDPEALRVSLNQLSQAKNFSIDCYVCGNLRSFYADPDDEESPNYIDLNDLWQGRGMSDQLEALKRKERFIYKGCFHYLDDNNRTEFAYIHNGKSYDIEDLCKCNFASEDKNCEFFGNIISMYADFDHAAYPDIVKQLRDAARSYLTAIETNIERKTIHSGIYTRMEVNQVEELWEEEDEEGIAGYLLNGNSFVDADLSKSKQFADQVNQILLPIADKCTIYMDYAILQPDKASDPYVPFLPHCFYDAENFGVASFVWRDHKLQIAGVLL